MNPLQDGVEIQVSADFDHDLAIEYEFFRFDLRRASTISGKYLP